MLSGFWRSEIRACIHGKNRPGLLLFPGGGRSMVVGAALQIHGARTSSRSAQPSCLHLRILSFLILLHTRGKVQTFIASYLLWLL